jgi:hypothetical protein
MHLLRQRHTTARTTTSTANTSQQSQRPAGIHFTVVRASVLYSFGTFVLFEYKPVSHGFVQASPRFPTEWVFSKVDEYKNEAFSEKFSN